MRWRGWCAQSSPTCTGPARSSSSALVSIWSTTGSGSPARSSDRPLRLSVGGGREKRYLADPFGYHRGRLSECGAVLPYGLGPVPLEPLVERVHVFVLEIEPLDPEWRQAFARPAACRNLQEVLHRVRHAVMVGPVGLVHWDA